MPLSCDCYGGCWGVHAREQGWPTLKAEKATMEKCREWLVENGTRGTWVILDDTTVAFESNALRNTVYDVAVRQPNGKDKRSTGFLTFNFLRDINTKRAELWHKGGLTEWSISDWAVAMAGEAGEVCDAVKKLNRMNSGFTSANNPPSQKEAYAAIAQEIGDTVLYLDLLASRCGLKLEDCVRETFNRVTRREAFGEDFLL